MLKLVIGFQSERKNCDGKLNFWRLVFILICTGKNLFSQWDVLFWLILIFLCCEMLNSSSFFRYYFTILNWWNLSNVFQMYFFFQWEKKICDRKFNFERPVFYSCLYRKKFFLTTKCYFGWFWSFYILKCSIILIFFLFELENISQWVYLSMINLHFTV